jgi:hypothetical protein
MGANAQGTGLGMKWVVQVVEHDTDRVERSIDCESHHKAERVEDGLNINLNHARYYTRIVEKGPTS